MKSHRFILPLVILLGLLCWNCQEQPAKGPERPRDVWVFRSVLDQKPRMLTAALHDQLWVAYNTQTASLYKTWGGSVNLEGAVYTSAHGPQPSADGIPYMVEPDGNPWMVGQQTPEVVYKGHRIANNQLYIDYDLVAGNTRLSVTEQPEFMKIGGEGIGFKRVFTLTGAPEGTTVELNLHLRSLTSEQAIQTNAQFMALEKSKETVIGQDFFGVDGVLQLNPNGTTELLTIFAAKPQTLAAEQAKLSQEEAVQALMANSDCNTCHNKEVKTVGPAYVDIAAKYEFTAEKLDELANKVIKGGAGNWGPVAMTAHPDLAEADAKTMVAYILGLDGEEMAAKKAEDFMVKPTFEISFSPLSPQQVKPDEEKPGIALNVFLFGESINKLPKIAPDMLPVASGVLNAIYVPSDRFQGLETNFAFHLTGFLNIPETKNIVFRLVSDDGSKLIIDDQVVIDHDGPHGPDPKDGEIVLKAGKHPFRVEYFQGGGGKGLSLQWMPHGAEAFTVVPPDVFSYKGMDIKATQTAPVSEKGRVAPGDGMPLSSVHPSFDLAQARPSGFKPKVGGMDFLPNGKLLVSTWDSAGAVYLLDGVQGNDTSKITMKRIAFGLAEPLGLKVVDGEIYVLQKQELTKLVDLDGDEIIDQYQTVCNGWRVSANFHEFAFGLLYKDGYFYGALATAINPGGASTQPQIPDRGKVVKISKADGSFSLIASGLRTPNGIGFGVDDQIYIADNQGDWLPSSKIVHVQEGAFYGSRSVDFAGTAGLTETQPVVWLPQDEIGNSPSQPAKLNVGPYQNQMIHGEVTHGGIKRVFAEKINGMYQGAVFRFTQGLEAGVNRLVWGPDGALYVGGVGSTGNWGHAGKLSYGLQRLTYNGKTAFEMLAIRAKPNGIEIEFTEPLKAGVGEQVADYQITQFRYQPTAEYGGPKLDEAPLPIQSITVSPDRKKAFLKLGGMKPKHVIYVRLNLQTFQSASGQKLWSTEAWYNMVSLPTANEA